jgi:RNA polymerase sigma-70 factor, ECF subfamily
VAVDVAYLPAAADNRSNAPNIGRDRPAGLLGVCLAERFDVPSAHSRQGRARATLSQLDAGTAADLVRRIVAGERGAESELVERCGDTLRFLARRTARDDADAEDLYQETLILALQKIRQGEVREPEALAGFLRALVKNLGTQRYRLRRYSAETSATELPDVAGDERAGILDDMLHRERTDLTRRLLTELPVPRDREVLFRYYVAEEDSPRICADLGIDADHFYRVLHRARQRFRRLWEERDLPAPGFARE